MAVFWAFTFTSISLNRWFTPLEFTFSKLGNPKLAVKPWIFQTGLVIGGIFMVLFAIHLVRVSSGKIDVMGGAYVLISGVFMALIGPIHDGLKPHDTLAFLTFWIFFIGMALFGIGKRSGLVTLPVLLGAIVGQLLPVWPHLGTLELYGLILVLMDVIFTPILK